ncbi:uncharacterized protein DEA37_0010625 [Paragonimus westermani]|uniref:Uncharacterized protein n=1 Tax=Paragonimus westermani TaxID=34504 RepID=A0A5J4NVA2_9TREM|nr:uncharacterized protein DEA37_0010625 [Paragonimus westermani]
MTLTGDICPSPEGAEREEDGDLRIIAELNNPRIYKEVRNVLQQEQRVKTAITRNRSLPFPCKCHQLCEFGSLLNILFNAFEKLYEAYEALHTDYTTIFRASAFLVSGVNIQLQDTAHALTSSSGPVVPAVVNVDDFVADVGLREERKKALANEDIWRKTYELHMECVRLCMLKITKPGNDRFVDWIKSHVWATTKCICYHCDYRDALVSYRQALLKLHLEYMSLYANYLALLHCYRVQDSRQTSKTIVVRGIPLDVIETMFSG